MTLTTDILATWTTANLITFHNTHTNVDPNAVIKVWKKAKSGLIDMIVENTDLEVFDADGEPMETREVSDDKPTVTIKSVALDALCEVAYYEDKTQKSSDENRVSEEHPSARSVGYSYLDVLAKVRSVFPDCETSVACLRWYNVRMNQGDHGYEGHTVPQRRIRAKAKKAAVTTEEA